MTLRRSSPSGRSCGRASARGRSRTSRRLTATDAREKSYVLEMLPYPSGEPHIGHLKNYALGDAIAHFHRRIGRRVLHPMGYDAFGLPAENNAIKTGVHPRIATDRVDRRLSPLVPLAGGSRSTGRASSAPTSRRTTAGRSGSSCKLFERGLAYRKEAAVKWCPHDQTVLANEQVIDGRCERCGAPGRDAPARAVVLPDHRLRRPAARRPRHDRLARARQDDAAQLDRAQRGRRGHLPLRGAWDRLSGVHDPARHAVRRDLLRDGARAPRRVQAGRGHRARAAGARVRQPCAAPSPPRSAWRRRQAEDRRPARAHRDEPRQRRADPDVRRRLRADGVRHRRDHGGAGARPARLRLRDGVRACRSAAVVAARRRTRRRRRIRGDRTRESADDAAFTLTPRTRF